MNPTPSPLVHRLSLARRWVRVVAWASNGCFGLSLLVLAYASLRLRHDDLITAPSAIDTALPLVALTTASFIFPIALLSTLTLVRVPPPR